MTPEPNITQRGMRGIGRWIGGRIDAGRSRLRWALVLVFVALIGVGAASGLFDTSEDRLDSSLSAFRSTPASGQLHLVEMDAASMDEYRRWPWPREHYGKVVDQLNAAGVRSITFDVDFSAASEPASDSAFSAALARSDAEIILPTFSQVSSFKGAAGGAEVRMLDSVPIESLRQHVTLGSASVLPDGDGMVRSMPMGTLTEGQPRPSMAAQIAKRSGEVGEVFSVDLSIDPATIPRHSFVDVERGSYDAGALRGADVLIGATAVEAFDRYPVPGHGVIPGVVLQAMAAETLYAGAPLHIGFVLPLLLAAGIAGWILSARQYGAVFVRSGAGAIILLATDAGSWAFGRAELVVIPALVLVLAAMLGSLAFVLRARTMAARHTDDETGLPNLRNLEAATGRENHRFVVAAMIGEFDTLRAVVPPKQMATLFARIVDRLKVSGCDGELYRVDDRVLAWTSPLQLYELEDQLAGLRAVMRSPVEVAGQRVDVTLSFGVADRGAVAGATHAASEAMRHRDPWRYHEDAESAALAQQISLMGELDEGVENGQLQVFYQPKLNLQNDRMSSVEALVRWQHPTRGFLRPDVFIPLAEENDRIADLTLFVLRRTIEDLGNWCEQGLVIDAAVNISAKLVSSPSFIDRAKAILRDSGVPRNRLTFEITESAELENSDATRDGLLAFRDLGVSISMDDYGTGQSTLSYLKQLPLSELKIDRSFVQFAHTNKGDAMLVRSTVQLAHELGLRVVAEGVEDQECLEFLRSIQCDYAQGYLIGKPMTAEDFSEVLVANLQEAA